MNEVPAPPQPRPKALVRLAWLYAAVLAGMLAIRFGAGDGSAWWFASNALLLYGFLPLPLVLVIGIFARRRDLLLVVAFAGAVWAYLWGGLFVPRAAANTAPRTITVLTYNVLGYNSDGQDAVRVIHDSGADLVVLNELNPQKAEAIERELAIFYPYRWLEPRVGVRGAGILSKFRFERVEPRPLHGLPLVGEPMAIAFNVEKQRVTLLGFHAPAGPPHFRDRERVAQGLADYARTRNGPLILAGDLNATDQNTAYALIRAAARDAWREVGSGFGHTFPGPPTPKEGGSRPVLLGVPAPLWLVRIDYVFHSDELEAVDARLSAGSSGSDHRGVIATLALR